MPAMAHASFNTLILGTRALHPESGKSPYARVPVWAKKQWNTQLAENTYPHELVTNAGVKLLATIPSFAVLIIPPTLFFLGEQLLAFIKPARLDSSLPFSFMWLFMPVLCDSFRLYQSLFSNFSVNSWWRTAWHRVLLLLTAADTKHTVTFWDQHGTALQSLDILNLINFGGTYSNCCRHLSPLVSSCS